MTNYSMMHVLSSLSCSEGESNVYLFLAENGISNLSTIAKRLHLSRTTTYAHVEKLLTRKFILKTKLKKRNLYEVSDPDFILSEFERVYKEGTQALNCIY